MTTKLINCPKCGKQLECWAIADFIECTGCKERIQVEPCNPEVIEKPPTEEGDLDGIDI